MHGGNEKYFKYFSQKVIKRPLGKPRHRISIQVNLKEAGYEMCTGFITGQGLMEGFLEHINEPSCCMKDGEFTD
jgi:hypothetical protein